MKTRACLVGFGLAGRYFHAPLMHAAGIEIRAVVSRQREAIASVLPNAVALEHLDHALSRDDIELIVVATPSDQHAQQAKAALLANKHVVVDKPICLTVAECEELIDLAASRKCVLTAFHNRRWDADFLTIERLVARGALGELASFHARWDRFRPTIVDRWREHGPGGGVLYDLGAHLIDQALRLFGRPEWIQADVFAQRAGATAPDGFELWLGQGSRRISLGVSSLAADNAARYRVHGERGSFVKAGLDPQEAQLRSGMTPTDAAFGTEAPAQWGTVTNVDGLQTTVPSERGRWIDFYATLLNSIEHGAPPPVDPRDAREVVRIIEAAMESSRMGRRVSL